VLCQEHVTIEIILVDDGSTDATWQIIERLNKDGLTDAHISKMTNTDKVRVVYGNYNAQEDAYEALNKLRADNRNVFKDAWVLKLKSSD
jgi:glycosyltransferase involved in cell wall biosynthesis